MDGWGESEGVPLATRCHLLPAMCEKATTTTRGRYEKRRETKRKKKNKNKQTNAQKTHTLAKRRNKNCYLCVSVRGGESVIGGGG